MTPLKHIRTSIIVGSQADIARLAGVTQASVSRWERGVGVLPWYVIMRLRSHALAKGMPWDDAAVAATYTANSDSASSSSSRKTDLGEGDTSPDFSGDHPALSKSRIVT